MTADSNTGSPAIVALGRAATSGLEAVYMCRLWKFRVLVIVSIALQSISFVGPLACERIADVYTPWTGDHVALALPYEFDTSDVWRLILKGTFALTLLMILSLLYTVASRQWAAAVPLAWSSAMLFFVTRVFVRFQTGSVGTLSADRVVIQPNRFLWFSLTGPVGTYTLDRFSAVRVEFSMGPVQPGVQGGPNEVVWLVGRPGTPDIALARTNNRAGRAVGREIGALLNLPVEEVGVPKVIKL